MGELPADLHNKRGSARWAVPLALAAIVAIAAVYEWTRLVPEDSRGALDGRNSPVSAPTLALPPPVSTPVPAPEVLPLAYTQPATSVDAPVLANPAPASSIGAGNTAMPGNAPLVLVFRGSSWVEVKDSKGALLLSTMGFPGARHAVDGAIPLDVVLGNAEAVVVTVRGENFDLAPHTRQNVAKFTVK